MRLERGNAPSATFVSSLTFAIFWRPSSSFRLWSVVLKKSEWLANLEPEGMPLLYCEGCQKQTRAHVANLSHLASQEATCKRGPHSSANIVLLVDGPMSEM